MFIMHSICISICIYLNVPRHVLHAIYLYTKSDPGGIDELYTVSNGFVSFLW